MSIKIKIYRKNFREYSHKNNPFVSQQEPNIKKILDKDIWATYFALIIIISKF